LLLTNNIIHDPCHSIRPARIDLWLRAIQS
jgi:hypothetical protein